MDQDIVFQLGSIIARAIPIAMGLVAIVAGWVMVFDAVRFYRNRATKVTSNGRDPNLDSATAPAPGASLRPRPSEIVRPQTHRGVIWGIVGRFQGSKLVE